MIKQAIIPLAGMGTRLLPLTTVIPKELLPINGKPGLEYILDECIDAGIKEIILIISKNKNLIKNYFYKDKFYKKIIKKKQDKRILKEFNKIKRYRKTEEQIRWKAYSDLCWRIFWISLLICILIGMIAGNLGYM